MICFAIINSKRDTRLKEIGKDITSIIKVPDRIHAYYVSDKFKYLVRNAQKKKFPQ